MRVGMRELACESWHARVGMRELARVSKLSWPGQMRTRVDESSQDFTRANEQQL